MRVLAVVLGVVALLVFCGPCVAVTYSSPSHALLTRDLTFELLLRALPVTAIAAALAVLAPDGRAFLHRGGGWAQVFSLSFVFYVAVESLARSDQPNHLTMVALLGLVVFLLLRAGNHDAVPPALCLAAALVLCTACGQAPPSPPAAAAHDFAAEERRAYEASIERLEAEVREARTEAQLLRDRLSAVEPVPAEAGARCEHELAVTREELERYRAGLERAVEQLNAAGAPPAASLPSPRPRSTGADPGHIASRLGPYLTYVGESHLVAHGTLWSYREEATQVRLTLVLTERGKEVHRETLQVRVPGHSNFPYRQQLRFIAIPGREYLVSASLDY